MTRTTTHINARHGRTTANIEANRRPGSAPRRGCVAGRGCARRRPMPRRARRGLVNVLLTVAIVAVVLVGTLALYGQINTSVRTQATQSILTIAEAELRRIYASQTQYEANLTPILFSVMPTNAIRGTGATRDIVTPWGGEVFAGGGATPDNDGTGTATADRFYITVLLLPEAACEALAQAYLNRSNVVSVNPEGTAATAPIVARATPTLIQVECDGGDDDKIAIVFRG